MDWHSFAKRHCIIELCCWKIDPENNGKSGIFVNLYFLTLLKTIRLKCQVSEHSEDANRGIRIWLQTDSGDEINSNVCFEAKY